MASRSNEVKVTPLLGGKRRGAVCSLLEIGKSKLLLDCGNSTDYTHDFLASVAEDLNACGQIDAIIISHADFHHMGSLGIICSKLRSMNIPVYCTLPVHKFGQIMLYDFYLNKRMESVENSKLYNLDELDEAFSNIHTLKFNQIAELFNGRENISLSCFPAGRTIGGSIWRIQCGALDILYVMDVNLKKEVVLDGASLDLLPTSPTLLICDAGAGIDTGLSGSRAGAGGVSASSRSRKKENKEDSSNSVTSGLLTNVVDTLRGGGNVLFPCETGGRTLELLQLFYRHWQGNSRFGMYHIILLSHMSHNVTEFARMQLEWMGDALSRGFYNGKANPFDLGNIKLATSVREIEKKYLGPKVVFATDSSLSCGLSKELLLKWGGDPRNKVIFTDGSDIGSLAAQIRRCLSTPPVVATVQHPTHVELAGDELAEYQALLEERKHADKEAQQRKRRQDELSLLNAGREQLGNEEEEEDEDEDYVESNDVADGNIGVGAGVTASVVSKLHTRTTAVNPDQTIAAQKKKKARTSTAFSKFLEPSFPMFESQQPTWVVDEYGTSNDDIVFKDILAMESRWYRGDTRFKAQQQQHLSSSKGSLAVIPAGENAADDDTAGAAAVEKQGIGEEDFVVSESAATARDLVPWKIVPVSMQVQFTCDFQEVNISGRADFKAIKTITAKLTPTRLVVLRGDEDECEKVSKFATSIGIESYAPSRKNAVAFFALTEKLKIQIPQRLLSSGLKSIHHFAGLSAAANGGSLLVDTNCWITALGGAVKSLPKHSRFVQSEGAGTRVVKFVPCNQDEQLLPSLSRIDNVQAGEVQELEAADDEEANERVLYGELTALRNPCVGVASVGEVTIDSLRQLLRTSGTTVDIRHGKHGVYLVCEEQVVIRKEGDNDFVVEGPPIPAFYAARKALYQQYAFI